MDLHYMHLMPFGQGCASVIINTVIITDTIIMIVTIIIIIITTIISITMCILACAHCHLAAVLYACSGG